MTDNQTKAPSEPKGPPTSTCCQSAMGEASLVVGRVLWNEEHSVWALLSAAAKSGEEIGPLLFCPFCGSKLAAVPMNPAIQRERFMIADGLDTMALLEVHGEILRSLIGEGDTIADMLKGTEMPDLDSKLLVWEGIPELEGDTPEDRGIFFTPTGWRPPTLAEMGRFHRGISPILQDEPDQPVQAEGNGATPDQAVQERIVLSGRRLVPPRRWEGANPPGTVGRVAMALFKTGGVVTDSTVATASQVAVERVKQIREQQLDECNAALHLVGVDAVNEGGKFHLFENTRAR